MPDWRTEILREFTPGVARLTLVADPDGLLVEEGILQGIHERGFELIQFEDHVAFRFAYESKFRSRWDGGEPTDLVVVLRSASSELSTLPYDLLQAGRQLSFNLGDLFPNLSYPVVAAMDAGDLDSLYQAQKQHDPGQLGDNATKEFALRHVFEIAPELIKQPSDLLRVLLRRHYRGQPIPTVLDERFVNVLRQNGLFEDWPLERIVPDRGAFFAFLQERWPAFLNRLATSDVPTTDQEVESIHLEFSGPLDLPFEHDDVRIYIDNLFIEGDLQPVSQERHEALAATWAAVGIRTDSAGDRLRRMDGLIQSVSDTLPHADARFQDWLRFAYRWAELTVLGTTASGDVPEGASQRLQILRVEIDKAFGAWVQSRFAGLHNQPPSPPAMLHHVPRALARHIGESKHERVAMVVVDGLALDQWIVLRDVLTMQRPQLQIREGAVFAWVPTITSVSRQAAFAGKAPLYFPGSIHTTNKDAAHWTQFWADHGLSQTEVAYARGLGDGKLNAVEEILSHPEIRVVGLVIDKVDKIMHGMELGTAGMHNQVLQWAKQGFIADLCDCLFEHGFRVALTSDHGNIEAEGCGRPSEGAVADLRGERARVYPDEQLRSRVKAGFPDAIEWPQLGLPEDFRPLLAPNRFAFIRCGERIVGHGGISIEEVVVPLVHIERRAT